MLPLLCVLAGLSFVASMGPGYVFSMRRFAGGMLNMVVAPSPQVFCLLLCAVALAPLAVAPYLSRTGQVHSTFAGVYLVALAFVPAALGICDNLHLFFNGVGLYLLAFVYLARLQSAWPICGFAVLLLLAVPDGWSVLIPEVGAARHDQQILAAQDRQVNRWECEAQGEPIFAPVSLPFHMRRKLLLDGRLQPSYFSGLDSAFDAVAEEIKLAELHRASYVLAPHGILAPPGPDERRRLRILRFGYRYRIRFAAYLPMQRLRADLLAGATPVDETDSTGGMVLYRIR